MNTRIVTVILFVAAVTGCTARNAGAATLFVDTIPGGAIDQTLTKAPGDVFGVDILIENAADLAGFQFELAFDPSILSAGAVVSGGIFEPDTFPLDTTILPGSIRFAETTLLLTGLDVVAPAVLATVQFTVSGVGVSVLDLRQTVLADSLGGPISPILETDGVLNSTAQPAPIPEPSVLSLMSLGLALRFVGSRWRARRRP